MGGHEAFELWNDVRVPAEGELRCVGVTVAI